MPSPRAAAMDGLALVVPDTGAMNAYKENVEPEMEMEEELGEEGEKRRIWSCSFFSSGCSPASVVCLPPATLSNVDARRREIRLGKRPVVDDSTGGVSAGVPITDSNPFTSRPFCLRSSSGTLPGSDADSMGLLFLMDEYGFPVNRAPVEDGSLAGAMCGISGLLFHQFVRARNLPLAAMRSSLSCAVCSAFHGLASRLVMTVLRFLWESFRCSRVSVFC